MIKKIEVFVIECDVCTSVFDAIESGGDGTVFDTIEEAKAKGELEDWLVMGVKGFDGLEWACHCCQDEREGV